MKFAKPLIIAATLSAASAGALAFGHADAATATPVETPTDPDDKVKCRKIEVTGSLVRKGKVCRTIAEWKRLQQLGNDAARAIAGERICSGGECRGFEPPPNGE